MAVGAGSGGDWPGAPPGRPPARRRRIDFYRRFEALLARQGLGPRPRPDAPRICHCRRAHRRSQRGTGLRRPPCQLVEAFYRVRFGGLPLDNPQREAVEHELAESIARTA